MYIRFIVYTSKHLVDYPVLRLLSFVRTHTCKQHPWVLRDRAFLLFVFNDIGYAD
jgi:hypothetical protein